MDPSPKEAPSSKKPPEDQKQASPPAGLLPFEQHAAGLKLPAWQLAAVAAQKNWPTGLEVSESDFQAALKETLEGVIE